MSDEILHKHIQRFDVAIPGVDEDRIHDMVMEIIHERNAIIELFCKTFLAVQEAPTPEALRNLFTIIELECTMHDNCNQTFRIKLRDNEQKS